MTDRTEDDPERRGGVDAGVDPRRRRFLTAAGLAGAGAVAVSAASVVEADGAESPAEQIKGRYELTPHVARFYFLNRL